MTLTGILNFGIVAFLISSLLFSWFGLLLPYLDGKPSPATREMQKWGARHLLFSSLLFALRVTIAAP